MGGSTLNREDYKTAIPQLSAQLDELLKNNVIINRTVITLSEGKVSNLSNYLGYFQNLVTGYFQAIAGDIEYLSSREAYINHLKADIASFGYLTAETADLRYATIGNLNAAVARIGDLEADHVSVSDFAAATGRIGDLEADHVSVSDLAATNADVAHLKVGDLTIGGVTVNIYDLAIAIKNSAMASGTTWYKVSASTPTAPVMFDPTSDGWSQTEPAYVGGTTDHLYSCLRVVYADDDPLGTRHFQWSDVHMIQSWEAAKSAYSYAGDAAEAANKAVKDLSQVENVVGVVNWIAEHGEMISQAGGTFDPAKVYFIVDPNGDYHIGNTHYSVVAEPKAEDIDDYYILNIDESVQNYVTTHLYTDGEGLWLIPEDNATAQTSSKKILIAVGGTGHAYETAGTYIIEKIDGVDKTIAKFLADGAQIGQDEETHAEIDYHSLKLVDKEGNTYFHVSDLRTWEYVLTFDTAVDNTKTYYELTGTDTYTEVTPIGTENPKDEGWYEYACVATVTETSTKEILIAYTVVALPVYNVKSVTINGSTASATKISGNLVYHTPTGDVGDEITITYTTASEKAKAYTLGKRGSGNIGVLSIAEGSNTIASGTASHAEGSNTVASDNSAHAEGDSSIANNVNAHAEGYASEASGLCSHAEGMNTYATDQSSHSEGQFTHATGLCSHAEGFRCIASGESSHAQNENTITGYYAQTAIGKYNDNQSNNAFEIGNGADSDNRSNGFAVDWDGNVKAQGWAGFVQMYAGSTAPNGWLFCDGSEVAVADYPLLYAVVGNTYGTPSDSDHFLLPDLRGRTPIGAGQGTGLTNRTLGGEVGAETHKLKGNESGQKSVSISSSGGHTHTVTSYYRSTAGYSSGSAARPYTESGSSSTTNWASIGSDTGKHTHSISESNATNAHNNMQPSLGINFIICTGETS